MMARTFKSFDGRTETVPNSSFLFIRMETVPNSSFLFIRMRKQFDRKRSYVMSI